MSMYEVLEEKLLDDFGYNEPIIVKEIDSENNYRIEKKLFRKYLSRLYENDKLQRYENGVYYFPAFNKYYNDYSKLSEEKVIEKKFISYCGEVFGYKTGYSFASFLGLTLQVPQVTEIATENISKSTVEDLGKKYIIKKARVAVTKENYKILQVLDILTDYYDLIEGDKSTTKKKLADYLSTTEIDGEYFKLLMGKYPAKTSKILLSKGYLDIFRQEDNANVPV